MSEPSKADAALAAALVKARDMTESVEKRSQNTHSNYWYASADDVVQTARTALAACGVSVIPTISDMVQVGQLSVLQRSFRVVHVDGGFIEAQTSWPLKIIKGEAGKATAAAETTSYSYYLKTLLDMRRGPKDDIDHDSHNEDARPQPAANFGPGLAQEVSEGAQKVLGGIERAQSVDALNVVRDWFRENRTHFSGHEVALIQEAAAAKESELMSEPAAGEMF